MSKINIKKLAGKVWDGRFGPSYTPMEMLDLGVFEGLYTAAISNIPGKYKSHKNVLPRGSKPDVELNRFKIKSRQSLKQWEEKGWTTKDSPLGWWEWYIKYFEGRRIPAEDRMQINRFRSFVARHQGQIVKAGKVNDLTTRTKQRQGLLQWGWDSTVPYSEEAVAKNAIRLAKITGTVIINED
jgi:hypothetical protein